MLRFLEHHSQGAPWEELKQEQGSTSGLLRFWMKEFVSQSEGPILPQHCPCQQPIRSGGLEPEHSFTKGSKWAVPPPRSGDRKGGPQRSKGRSSRVSGGCPAGGWRCFARGRSAGSAAPPSHPGCVQSDNRTGQGLTQRKLRTSPLLDAGVHAHLVSVDDQQQRHKQLTQDQHHQQAQVLGRRKQRGHGGRQDVGVSALRCYSPPSGAAPSCCERRCSR